MRTYHRDGNAAGSRNPSWLDCLEEVDKTAEYLSPEKAVALGLLHSRDYQLAMETLYTISLTLTLDRWAFALQWFGTNNTTFTQFGSSVTEDNTLASNSSFGFTKNLAAGGQLLANFANSFVFTASGVNSYTWTSNIIISLMQPLLQNAGRRVALENLTQAERNVLYAVRTFARFRKQFYVNLTNLGGGSSPGYLGLLGQVENIRIQEANLENNEQSLAVIEALFAHGTVSTVEVDDPEL